MILSSLLAWTLALGTGGPRTLIVSPGSELPTLTAALAQSRDGDTIRVLPGEYHEPLITVARRVTILGEGGPVFRGGDHQVFTITGDSVTIRGLVIRDITPSATEDRAGIKVLNARGCRIEDNTLIDTFFGIYLSRVTGCLVRDNQIRATPTSEPFTGNGIHSWSSSNLVIERNVVQGHRDGIYFEFTTASEVRRNVSAGNLRYGLHFMFSHGCAYTANTFEGNRAGIAVMYSHDVTMLGNRFAASWGSASYGLLLKDITDSRIEDNLFVGNSVAFHGEGTVRMRITGNQFLDNGWAVQILTNAEDTEFRRNRFEGNSFDVSTNGVHASSRFVENYWDRYQGYDLDRDGFGDIPFSPVRLFALVVQQNEPALILLRSFFVSLLDAAERVVPVLTPRTLEDARPLMRWHP